jgi:hypothetical protein
MSKTPTESANGNLLAFPEPVRERFAHRDPRWTRIEALYAELQRLAPGDFREELQGRLEQAFCHYLIGWLIDVASETDGVDGLVNLRVLAEQIEIEGWRDRPERRAAVLRLRKGQAEDQTADDDLEDLLVDLQRAVDDGRRAKARAARIGGAQ